MDPVRNPYTPNAGARPPALAGRDELTDKFALVLERVASGRTEKGYLVTGLRGVGKTVLLGEFETLARNRGAIVITHEAPKEAGALTRRFPGLARKALLEMSPAARWGERARRTAGILRGFKATFDPEGRWSVTYDAADIEDVEGVGDSGDFTVDLPDVLEALGEAAASHDRLIVFLIDEIQHLETRELSALVMAKHRINRRSLPIVIAGAGLPQLPGLTTDAQTYSERMFHWPRIGQLPAADARLALLQPASREGVVIEEDALAFIVEYTEGYPYFLQEYGRAIWDAAEDSPITLQDALDTQATVEAVLDQDFFAMRVAGLPDAEIRYLQAMAGLGPGEHPGTEVAEAMGKPVTQVSSAQGRLVVRGLLYRPQRGVVAFTVPQFDRYMLRAFPSE